LSFSARGKGLSLGRESLVLETRAIHGLSMAAAGWHHCVRVFGGECTAAAIREADGRTAQINDPS